ncbi:MAG: DUF1697 domain-containing protein [Candidatus Thorarchaeota archaeon]
MARNTYVAFLRGINSGRNPSVKMHTLRAVFESLGFDEVRTVLASGNVIFEAKSTDKKILESRIEEVLPDMIGFESPVILLTAGELQKLFLSNPFKDVVRTLHKKLYTSFVKQDEMPSQEYPIDGEGFTILGVFNGVVCSVVNLPVGRTPELMRALDRVFGKTTTTRSWSTIERILKMS